MTKMSLFSIFCLLCVGCDENRQDLDIPVTIKSVRTTEYAFDSNLLPVNKIVGCRFIAEQTDSTKLAWTTTTANRDHDLLSCSLLRSGDIIYIHKIKYETSCWFLWHGLNAEILP